MKLFIYLISLIICSQLLFSQGTANYVQDNGQAGGSYSNATNYEESVYLQPQEPGKLNKLYVYLTGNEAKADTIRIIGDPSDGYIPGTWWVSGFLTYNLIAEFIIQHQGSPAFYELDMSNLNIEIGGINRIGISHIVKPGGPYFAFDTDGLTHQASFLNNVFVPNPQFFNIAGTMISFAQGDFIVRADIDFLYSGDNAEERPEARLVDVTETTSLLSDSNPLRANEATIVDFNRDGIEDLIINGNYLENKGGSFENVSNKFEETFSKSVWGDLDNDGYLDFYVATGSDADEIWYGTEDPYTFEEWTDLDIQIDQPTMSPLFLDYDLDGDLDIFVAYNRRTVNNQERYYQDQLFRNDGDREFTLVTEESGIADGEPAPFYDCYGANVVDYNNDGWPDIFVATYRLAPDLLYKNNGDGTFDEVGMETGVIGNQTAQDGYYGHGMGSDWGDFNNDGYLDLVVGNLGHPDSRGAASNPSLIFESQEANSFIEKRAQMGLKFFEMNSGPTWVDLNNDGLLDLWACQYSYDRIENTSNQKMSRVYINQGPEQNYFLRDRTWEFESYIHGAWTALPFDHDNDGDQDLVVLSNREHVKLFDNQINSENNYLKVKNITSKEVEPVINSIHYDLTTNENIYTQQNVGTKNMGRTTQGSDIAHFGIPANETIESLKITGFYSVDGELRSIVKNYNVGINETFEFDLNSSVHVIDNIRDSKLFPNPSDKFINIQFKADEASVFNIYVNDLNGNRIQTIAKSKSIDSMFTQQIDISSFVPGTYFIEIESDGRSKVMKFIVS